MASSRPPTVEALVPEDIEDITTAWRELMLAANAGDLQAAIFLQKFAPWARERLERWEWA